LVFTVSFIINCISISYFLFTTTSTYDLVVGNEPRRKSRSVCNVKGLCSCFYILKASMFPVSAVIYSVFGKKYDVEFVSVNKQATRISEVT
jgi:hypothetical protein